MAASSWFLAYIKSYVLPATKLHHFLCQCYWITLLMIVGSTIGCVVLLKNDYNFSKTCVGAVFA